MKAFCLLPKQEHIWGHKVKYTKLSLFKEEKMLQEEAHPLLWVRGVS